MPNLTVVTKCIYICRVLSRWFLRKHFTHIRYSTTHRKTTSILSNHKTCLCHYLIDYIINPLSSQASKRLSLLLDQPSLYYRYLFSLARIQIFSEKQPFAIAYLSAVLFRRDRPIESKASSLTPLIRKSEAVPLKQILPYVKLLTNEWYLWRYIFRISYNFDALNKKKNT